jgi:hypothetical protein
MPWSNGFTFLLMGGALMSLCVCGCSTPAPICPGSGPPSISVTVTDAATGMYICNASVVATAGGANRSLPLSSTGASCSYSLDRAPAGTYTVAVTAPGYKPAQESNVSIMTDSCGHAENPNSVTIKLVSGA